MPVEDWPDVDAAEEAEEGVYGEDPAYDGMTISLQLVARQIRLEDCQRVHQPQ